MEKKLYDLTVDPQFERLCPPLREAERALLEESIVANGCEMPLIVWAGKNIIVDGHNRYAICKAHGIPFAVEEKEFGNEDAVIYWLVMNQLGRRNLSSYIAAVKTAHDVYRKLGPVRYSTMMVLVRNAWNGEAWSVSQNMLRGMAEFYSAYGDCFKTARFMKNLQGVPRAMLERAVGKYYGIPPRVAYALAIASFYNKKGGIGTLDLTRLTVRG